MGGWIDRQMDRWMDGWRRAALVPFKTCRWADGRETGMCVFIVCWGKRKGHPIQCFFHPSAPLPAFTQPPPRMVCGGRIFIRRRPIPELQEVELDPKEERQSDGWCMGQLKQESKGFGPCVTSS